jgi:acyl carrier protein
VDLNINTQTSKPSVDPRTLLQTVEQVVYELYPHKQATLRITLDSSLDRDLGLDSLARMELLMRIEHSLDVRLPERTLANAETPRDLLRASLAAGPEHRSELTQVSLAPDTDEVEAIPERARTLTEVLRWHVASHPALRRAGKHRDAQL